MPSSSKQTSVEDLLGEPVSGNVTNTLLRSGDSVGCVDQLCYNSFESQVTTNNRPETSRSNASYSQLSGIQDYGAISKRSIGVAYKIIEDRSGDNGDVAANMLRSGMKLAETSLTWPFELFNLVRNSVGHGH